MFTRRTFLQSLSATAVASMTWTGRGYAQDVPRPNVLFIPVDDLNGWIGCLGGHPQAKTPNIDRLAARGVNFTRAYCTAPLCNPSRASLMSGLRPSTTGCYYNNQPWRPAMPDAVTMQQYFKANGYRVMGGGKIYHGAFEEKDQWDEYLKRPDDPVPPVLPANGIKDTAHFDWGALDVGPEEMGDWKLADWAVERLNQKWDQPFFLAPGLVRPHLPWYVPRKYMDMFPAESVILPEVPEDDLNDIPPAGQAFVRRSDHKKVIESDNWAKAVASYLALIAFVDDVIGRILDGLEQSPYADNTIVVLWGDHGWHLGEKFHWRKFTLWEEATRNPFFIAAPGVTAANSRCDHAVSLLDVYPTLVDLCGLPPKPELEGQSLKPLLEAPNREWDRPAVTTYGKDNHSVRNDRWRYIRYADGSEELYDHTADEMEWKNRAGDPDLVPVKKELAKWLPTKNVDYPGPQKTDKD